MHPIALLVALNNMARLCHVGATALYMWQRWLTAAIVAPSGPHPVAPHALARRARRASRLDATGWYN